MMHNLTRTLACLAAYAVICASVVAVGWLAVHMAYALTR